MDLYLIRHPQPDVAPGICYGRSDVGLAAEAAAAARGIRAHLPAGAAVYTSPLRRCRLLAEHLAARPRTDARLQEMHFGDWEMRRWDELERGAFAAWLADLLHFAPPGGESAAQMLRRTLEFVSELQGTAEEAAIVVTHGGVLRVLFAHWLELAPPDWRRLRFDFCGVSKAKLDARGARVVWLNRRG